MALLLVQLGLQPAEVLRIFRLLVAFSGLALAGSLPVVEASAVLFGPALDIPVSLDLFSKRGHELVLGL